MRYQSVIRSHAFFFDIRGEAFSSWRTGSCHRTCRCCHSCSSCCTHPWRLGSWRTGSCYRTCKCCHSCSSCCTHPWRLGSWRIGSCHRTCRRCHSCSSCCTHPWRLGSWRTCSCHRTCSRCHSCSSCCTMAWGHIGTKKPRPVAHNHIERYLPGSQKAEKIEMSNKPCLITFWWGLFASFDRVFKCLPLRNNRGSRIHGGADERISPPMRVMYLT